MPGLLHPSPANLRLRLIIASLFLFSLVSIITRALFLPNKYIYTCKILEKGPGHAADLKKISLMDPYALLYLAGPIMPTVSVKTATLFPVGANPLLSPCQYKDATGSVNIISPGPPSSTESISNYFFGQPIHMLGRRSYVEDYSLLMIGKTKADLLALVARQIPGWEHSFFIQGLILFFALGLLFWFIARLISPNLRLAFKLLLSINSTFLTLVYAALLGASYPIWSTLPYVLGMLSLGNACCLALAWFVNHRPSKTIT